MQDFPNPDTYVCTYKTLTTFVLRSQVVLNLSNLSLAGHVVAEVRDKDNEPLIHLIGRGNVETVVSHDVIGRLMLMSVRQPGLAEVYRVVLGFDGDEFYSAQQLLCVSVIENYLFWKPMTQENRCLKLFMLMPPVRLML